MNLKKCRKGIHPWVPENIVSNGGSPTCRACRKISDSKRDPVYNTWRNIKTRCTNPARAGAKYYLEKGIRIAPEWENDSKAFVKYIYENLGPRPSPKHSIDRIDNRGNYEPGNIRWADRATQNANKSSNLSKRKKDKLRILVQYTELSLNRIAKETGVSWRSVRKYGRSHPERKRNSPGGFPV